MTFGEGWKRWAGGLAGSARVSEVGRGGLEEDSGTGSSCLVCEEDDVFFSVSVFGMAALAPESVSASASRSQPESSNTMSKDEEVQSLGPRGGQSSNEFGVSEASGSAWLSLSDIRLSWPGSGWKDSSPKTTLPVDRRAWASTDASRVSPSGPEAGDTELDTGTLNDITSMWSRMLTGQSVVL